MFATVSNRVEAMKMLIASGANVKAATKIVDLKSQTNPEEEAFLRAQQGGQRQGGAPAAPAGRGRAEAAPAEAAYTSAAQTAAPPAEAAGGRSRGGRGGAAAAAGGRGAESGGVAGLSRQFRFAELVSAQGGLAPLHFAARQGYVAATQLLLDSGADINQMSGGDNTSPLLIAIVNGH